MSDDAQFVSEAARIAALEILALLQRAGDDDTIAAQIATRVQAAIEHADDTHLGLLRHVARILTRRDECRRKRRRDRARRRGAQRRRNQLRAVTRRAAIRDGH
jgi:hypothetical protein